MASSGGQFASHVQMPSTPGLAATSANLHRLIWRAQGLPDRQEFQQVQCADVEVFRGHQLATLRRMLSWRVTKVLTANALHELVRWQTLKQLAELLRAIKLRPPLALGTGKALLVV